MTLPNDPGMTLRTHVRRALRDIIRRDHDAALTSQDREELHAKLKSAHIRLADQFGIDLAQLEASLPPPVRSTVRSSAQSAPRQDAARAAFDDQEPDQEDEDEDEDQDQDQDQDQDRAPPLPDTAPELPTVAEILALFAAGNFDGFRAGLDTLHTRASAPPQVIVETVEITRPAGAAAGAGRRLPRRTGRTTFAAIAPGAVPAAMAALTLDTYDATDAPAVDPHYVWPKETPGILSQMARGAATLLVGPAGTGKSSLPEQIAARTGRPFIRIVCHDQTDAPTLQGMTTPTGWQDGAFTRAIRTPGAVIVIEEPSAARPAALFVIQTAAERPASGKRFSWLDEIGEPVPLADGVTIFLCDNTGGVGDETGEYEGTRLMNRSTLDRMGGSFRIDYMPANDETRVLMARTGCTRTLAAALVKFANLTRKDVPSGQLAHGVGLRRLIALAEMISDGYPAEAAYDAAIDNQARHADRERLRQLWRTMADVGTTTPPATA